MAVPIDPFRPAPDASLEVDRCQMIYRTRPVEWTTEPPTTSGTYYFRPALSRMVYHSYVLTILSDLHQAIPDKPGYMPLTQYTVDNPDDHLWPPLWYGPVNPGMIRPEDPPVPVQPAAAQPQKDQGP